MGKLKCGCVTADSKNTKAVREGFGLPGYIKTRCEKHQREWERKSILRTGTQGWNIGDKIKILPTNQIFEIVEIISDVEMRVKHVKE